MDIERSYGFIGIERELSFYNGKAVLNQSLDFYLDNDAQNEFGFTGYQSAYMRVYDSIERTYILKSFTTQLTRNANHIVINTSVSDMTFESAGKYWYELGFVQSGYEVPLIYGDCYIV